MFTITTNFHPYRLKLSRKKPVTLEVTITNKTSTEKKITFQLELSKLLSLDKSGFRSGEEKKIPNFPPKKTEKYTYNIHAKHFVEPGEYPARITIFEHYNDFKYVQQKYVKNITLTVEE
jgi:hypothetical protein